MIYLDHAATAPLCRAARDAMQPWLGEDGFGNPSSMYRIAGKAKTALETARQTVSLALGCRKDELYFTSGGTEGDNWALQMSPLLRPNSMRHSADGKHIVTSVIEHHAISHTLEFMQKMWGFEVTTLPVDKHGKVSSADLAAALRPETCLVTIMTANNEIGTIQDISALAETTKAFDPKIIFHTDAVQAAGHIPLQIDPNVDILTLSGHKFGAMKGVGAQFIRKTVPLKPLLHGGGHERGKRSSTENVAGIVGLAAALTASVDALASSQVGALRDRLVERILAEVPYSHLSGPPLGAGRLPGLASFVFEAAEGETLVVRLDMAGVCASSGSACSSASLDPSHVLLAIGLPHEIAHGSIRMSLGEENTAAEIDQAADAVAHVVAQVRAMSPLWDEDKQCPTERFWR